MAHVGHVHDVLDLVAIVLQGAAQNILKDVGPQIADVGIVIDRWPTGVHTHCRRPQRLKGAELARIGVKEGQRHGCC